MFVNKKKHLDEFPLDCVSHKITFFQFTYEKISKNSSPVSFKQHFFVLSSLLVVMPRAGAEAAVREFSCEYFLAPTTLQYISLIKSLSFSLLLHFGRLRLALSGAPAFCSRGVGTRQQIFASLLVQQPLSLHYLCNITLYSMLCELIWDTRCLYFVD